MSVGSQRGAVLAFLLVVVSSAKTVTADGLSSVVALEAIQPHIAIAGNRSIFVTFIQRGNICVAASRDRGRSFESATVAIDVGGRARGGAQRGPRIGVDAQGVITVTAPVTFDDAEYKKRYPTAELYFVQSKDGGKTWTHPARVNEVEKQAPEALHWMTVAQSGEVHVAWLDRRDRSGPGQDIYYSLISDGRVGTNRPIARNVCECCAPGLAVDSQGNAVIAYREGGTKPSRELFVVRSTARSETVSRPMRMNHKDSLEDG